MARYCDAAPMSRMVKLSMTTRMADLKPSFVLDSLYDFSNLHDTQRSFEILDLEDYVDTRWPGGPRAKC